MICFIALDFYRIPSFTTIILAIRKKGITVQKSNSIGLFFLGIFLASGIAVAGFFVSQTLYNSQVAMNSAEVKGLAERRVLADQANWSVTVSNVGNSRSQIPDLYAKTEQNQKQVIELLKASGFADEEIKTGLVQYMFEEYRDSNNRVIEQKHLIQSSVTVNTKQVEKVEQARATVNKLIVEGVQLINEQPFYLFTKLNDIKPEMLQEATRNARIAANEFATNAGVSVGSIQSATQGSFIVRDAGAEYGDTNKLEKDVRVVTQIRFFLTN